MKLSNFRKIQNAAILIITLCMLGLRSEALEDIPLSRQDKRLIYFHNASYDEMIASIRSLSATEKATLLETIHQNKSGLWTTVRPDIAFYLGDTSERKRVVADFYRIRFYKDELIRLGEPWIIERLAPEMFREEEYTNLLQGDIINEPLSYAVAGLIIANLQNANVYPDNVIQWANRTSPHALPELRAIMRDWWRQNERFFKEKDFQAVQPGREVTSNEIQTTVKPPQPVPQATAISSRISHQRPTSISHSESRSPPPALMWIGSAVGAALLTFWLLQQKRRN